MKDDTHDIAVLGSGPAALAIAAWAFCGIDSPRLFWSVAALAAISGVLFGVDSLRQRFVSAPLMRWVGGILPQVGETERTALVGEVRRLRAAAARGGAPPPVALSAHSRKRRAAGSPLKAQFSTPSTRTPR